MTTRRVLVATGIYPPDVGGPARTVRLLEDGLPRLGIEVVVVSFSRLLPLPWGLRHVRFFANLLASARHAQVLLALDPVSVGLPTFLAARLLRRPFVLRVGGDYAWEQAVERFGIEDDLDSFQDSNHGWRVEWLRRTERFVARRAARVIVPDRFLRDLLRRWGVAGDRITVVPNAVQQADLPPTRAEARAELRVEGRLIASAGRLLRLKGFEGLIAVVESLKGEFPDLRLAVIGSGPRHSSLADQIQRSRLEDTVMLLGALPHERTLLYLKAADLFVLNSAGEGQAHALLEAMALGTPVVATRAGGTRDVIDHGRTGLLVHPREPSDLREAIRGLLRDPERANLLARAAAHAAADFTVSRTVDETVAVLRSVA